jgi:hypothetical protein
LALRAIVHGVSAHGSGAGAASVVVLVVSVVVVSVVVGSVVVVPVVVVDVVVASVVVVGSSPNAAGAARTESASASRSARANLELLMQYPLVAYRTVRLLGGEEGQGRDAGKGRSDVTPGSCLTGSGLGYT